MILESIIIQATQPQLSGQLQQVLDRATNFATAVAAAAIAISGVISTLLAVWVKAKADLHATEAKQTALMATQKAELLQQAADGKNDIILKQVQANTRDILNVATQSLPTSALPAVAAAAASLINSPNPGGSNAAQVQILPAGSGTSRAGL